MPFEKKNKQNARFRLNPFHHITAMHLWAGALQTMMVSLLEKNVEPIFFSKQLLNAIQHIKKYPDQAKVIENLQRQAFERYGTFMQGAMEYYESPRNNAFVEAPTLLQVGSVRVKDYGQKYNLKAGTEKGVILFIPSLINRSHVFDIPEKNSLMAYLSKNGYRCLLVEWGNYSEEQKDFSLREYVLNYLKPLMSLSRQHFPDLPFYLTGYCMGGILGLGALMESKIDIDGIILMATPWDFSQRSFKNRSFLKLCARMVEIEIQHSGKVSGFFLNMLFHCLNPLAGIQKFRRFQNLEPAEKKKFVELEDWVNDCVDLAPKVAKECFVNWYLNNELAETSTLSSLKIDLESLDFPVLTVIPKNDRIIPEASALSLAKQLRQVTVLQPLLGHVGMITGRKAKKNVWQPLLSWLNTNQKITQWRKYG